MFFRFLALLLVPCALHAADPGRWEQLGPYEEVISALAFDPGDPAVIYAAIGPVCGSPPCRQGLLRSADGGTSWTALGDPGLAEPFRVFQLAVDPAASHVLYARYSFDGVLLRSADGGRTWSSISAGVTTEFVESFAVAETGSGSTLYMSDRAGTVFRSGDRGDTWSASEEPVAASFLAVDPSDAQVVYAAGRDGVFRSADGGATWSLLAAEPTIEARALWIDPAAPSTLYLLRVEDIQRELVKSTDGGQTWQTLDNAPDRPNRLTLDPLTSTLYAVNAQSVVWRSDDGGLTWTRASQGFGGWFLTANEARGGTVFATATNGIWRSLDGGEHWRAVNQGLTPAMVETLTVDPANETLYAGTYGEDPYEPPGSFIVSQNGGASWRFQVPPQVYPRRVQDVAVERLPPELGPPAAYAAVGSAGIYKSLDGGSSFTLIHDQNTGLIRIDPETPATLYVAQAGFGPEPIHKSVDGGASFFSASLGLEALTDPNDVILDLEIDPTNPSRLYLITDEFLYRSLDGGASWSESGDPVVQFEGDYRGIEIDPERGTLYAAFDHRDLGSLVLRSADGGLTWSLQPIFPRLGKVDDFALVPGDPPRFYVANPRLGVLRFREGEPREEVIDRVTGDGPEGVERLVALAGAEVPGADEGSEIVYAAGIRGVQRIELLEKSTLGLQAGRFTVEVEWRDASGASGPGRVATIFGDAEGGEAALRSQDSTVLQFFDEDNWEMLLKVLDGRAVNDHHWVFLGAATDVGYTVEITDTGCGTVKAYRNPVGTASPAVNDTGAFPECAAPVPPSCAPSPGVLCLGEDGRFRAEVTWRNALGQRDRGRQVFVPAAGFAESDDSGLFYFFSEENWELLVKVLDGCAVNGHYWVFGAATTDVEYNLVVTDSVTGETAEYFNPLGNAADAINDTAAFATCGME